MSDSGNLEQWVAYAEADYDEARVILRRKKPSTFIAAFHAQQSAEKYLKALLISEGKTFPKIHDLIKLNELCASAGVITGFEVQSLSDLTEYASRTRYPGESMSQAEAQEAYDIAKTIRKFARKFLNLK